MFPPQAQDLNKLKALREVVEQLWLLTITLPQITVCVTTFNEFLLRPNYKHINIVSATPSMYLFLNWCRIIKMNLIKLKKNSGKCPWSNLKKKWQQQEG